MSRSGTVTMGSAHATKIIDLGTELHGGDPLGFPQAAFVVLTAIASGKYNIVQVEEPAPPKQARRKPKPEEE